MPFERLTSDSLTQCACQSAFMSSHFSGMGIGSLRAYGKREEGSSSSSKRPNCTRNSLDISANSILAWAALASNAEMYPGIRFCTNVWRLPQTQLTFGQWKSCEIQSLTHPLRFFFSAIFFGVYPRDLVVDRRPRDGRTAEAASGGATIGRLLPCFALLPLCAVRGVSVRTMAGRSGKG